MSTRQREAVTFLIFSTPSPPSYYLHHDRHLRSRGKIGDCEQPIRRIVHVSATLNQKFQPVLEATMTSAFSHWLTVEPLFFLFSNETNRDATRMG